MTSDGAEKLPLRRRCLADYSCFGQLRLLSDVLLVFFLPTGSGTVYLPRKATTTTTY
jgi:hypothetical protein